MSFVQIGVIKILHIFHIHVTGKMNFGGEDSLPARTTCLNMGSSENQLYH